jgi:hypothetical protein
MIRKATARGRPPKFNESRRPITVTLPERTLNLLAAIDQDRARAIAKLADLATAAGTPDAPLVQSVEVAPGCAVVTVAPSRWLRRIPWLNLIELTASRYLLVVPPDTPAERLEVAISDLLEAVPPEEPREAALLAELVGLLRARRRGGRVSKAEILLV